MRRNKGSLASPMGHPAVCGRHLERTSAKHHVLLDRIPLVQGVQSAWLLLLHCACARANCLLRVVRPSAAANFAETHDHAVWLRLTNILRTDLSELALANPIWANPFRQSGVSRGAGRVGPPKGGLCGSWTNALRPMLLSQSSLRPGYLGQLSLRPKFSCYHRPPRFHTSPRTQTCTFEGNGLQKHNQNSTKKTPREKKKRTKCGAGSPSAGPPSRTAQNVALVFPSPATNSCRFELYARHFAPILSTPFEECALNSFFQFFGCFEHFLRSRSFLSGRTQN